MVSLLHKFDSFTSFSFKIGLSLSHDSHGWLCQCISLVFLMSVTDVPPGIFKANLAKIKESFAFLVLKVAEKLDESHSINMEKFRLYVTTLFPPGDIISEARSITTICTALSRNQLWDYSTYTHIEKFVKRFAGDDAEMKSWISGYKSEYIGFKASAKIADFIQECDEEPDHFADSDESIQEDIARYDKSYCSKLTFKLKTRVTEKSLVYIDDFWMSIADQYSPIPSLPVLLESIKKGCLEMTWYIPTLSTLQLQTKILTNIQSSIEFFREHKISRIAINDEILYEEEMSEVSHMSPSPSPSPI